MAVAKRVSCRRMKRRAPNYMQTEKSRGKVASALLCLGLLAFSGCARNYVLTLRNGSQLTADNKPRLKNGAYVFKDTQGQQMTVPAGRVAEIAPASMMPKPKSSK